MIAPVCQLWLSVCTLFLAGLRKASMPKVPSAWRLWIWLLLCVRYLVPLPSPNLFPLAFETHFGAVPVPTLWPALRWSVTLLLFLLFLVRWARWLFLFRTELCAPPPQAVQWQQTQNITKRAFRLACCPHIRAPLTCGLLRPLLLVPCSYGKLPSSALFPLLCHEAMHIHRFDLLKKRLALLVAVLYWYNPCCWLLFSMVERDMELACDAAVLKATSIHERKNYALALLTAAETAYPNTPLWNQATGGIMKERIVSILTPRHSSRCGRFLLAALFLLVICVVLAVPGAQAAQAVPDVTQLTAQQAEEYLTNQGFQIVRFIV